MPSETVDGTELTIGGVGGDACVLLFCIFGLHNARFGGLGSRNSDRPDEVSRVESELGPRNTRQTEVRATKYTQLEPEDSGGVRVHILRLVHRQVPQARSADEADRNE